MTKQLATRIGIALLFLLYPLMVYAGLAFFDPRWLILLLLASAGARLLGGNFPRRVLIVWAAAAVLAAAITLFSASETGLLLYPVLVNAVLLCLFLWSYLHPPSVIEIIARKADPDLPPSGVAYTRKVTLLWSGFFLFNGLISLYTLTLSRELWTLYNGLISYILMGLLMAGEWLVRQGVKKSNASV